MKADQDKCIACKRCFPYCPMGRIHTFKRHDKIPGRVFIEIDQDACTDCGECLRADVCPVKALYQQDEVWPREVRGILSNPFIEFAGSQVPGRGTEEMKTNDVKGTFLRGEVGVGVELGRPGVGAYFRDVEKVAMALMAADIGYQLATENPVTHFMSDKTTGKLRDEVLGEKATSAIIEGKCKLEKLPEALRVLKLVAKEIDSVLTVEVITKVPPEGEIPVVPILEREGYWYSINSKNNLGLGLPAFKFYPDENKP
ncbi:MAG TPA: 4Fe-4S dicluster domain-containing protein [Thermodesulfobacteriota bacterium]|nr:4Fe-4S dicluster domain-containing protein [Thermodesulfobacteriota bacterium]